LGFAWFCVALSPWWDARSKGHIASLSGSRRRKEIKRKKTGGADKEIKRDGKGSSGFKRPRGQKRGASILTISLDFPVRGISRKSRFRGRLKSESNQGENGINERRGIGTKGESALKITAERGCVLGKGGTKETLLSCIISRKHKGR